MKDGSGRDEPAHARAPARPDPTRLISAALAAPWTLTRCGQPPTWASRRVWEAAVAFPQGTSAATGSPGARRHVRRDARSLRAHSGWRPQSPAARRRPLLPLQVCAGRNVESAQLALLGEGSAAPSSLRASSARRPSSSLLHPRWKEPPLPDSFLQRGPLALARRATRASPLLPRRPGSACAATPGGHKVPCEPRSPYLPLLWAPLWNDGNGSGRPQTWSRAVCPKDRSRGDTVSSSRFFDRLLRWPRARPFLHTPPGVTAWGLTLHHLLFL